MTKEEAMEVYDLIPRPYRQGTGLTMKLIEDVDKELSQIKKEAPIREQAARRERIAVAMMAAVLTHVDELVAGTVKEAEELLGLQSGEYRFAIHHPALVARTAMQYTDALIAALEEGGEG